MEEALALHQPDQLTLREVKLDGAQPRPQQRARVVRAEAGAGVARARVALLHQPLDHREDRAGVGGGAGRLAAAERAGGERHRGVRPLRRAAVLAEWRGVTGPDLIEVVAPGRALLRLRERAADVDAGVIVRAADAGAAVCLDVDLGGRVELGRTRTVARLPDRKELRQAAAVARQERRLDGVERVRERACDLALRKLIGDGLDVAGERLQALVVGPGDPPAEDVHRLGLAAKPGRELLGDERVLVARGEFDRAVDRVVIGDRHEVHPAALGEVVDLLRRRRALRQTERALHAQLGHRRGGRMAMQVDPAGRSRGHRCSLMDWRSSRLRQFGLQRHRSCE